MSLTNSVCNQFSRDRLLPSSNAGRIFAVQLSDEWQHLLPVNVRMERFNREQTDDKVLPRLIECQCLAANTNIKVVNAEGTSSSVTFLVLISVAVLCSLIITVIIAFVNNELPRPLPSSCY